MTAEIAILNRVGVALAADSAVTISSRFGDPKTYNSADKLFVLDERWPVAVMIHGSAEFMGIPAETIIKRYRESDRNRKQDKLEDYARQFAEFMKHELPIEHAAIVARVAAAAVELLAKIRIQAEDDLRAQMSKRKRGTLKVGAFMARRMSELIDEGITELASANALGDLDEHLPSELPDIVKEAATTVLGEGMLARSDEITQLLTLALTRDITLGGEIGFVFAGFGSEQIFPAITSFECDMALVGSLRIRWEPSESISANQVAIISPFAQSEMVDRFMDGVDASYVDFVRELVRSALTEFGNQVAQRLGVEETPAAKARARDLRTLRDDYVKELEKASFQFRIGNYRTKILEVVQFMPKAELAEMAESLVNLTSIKRRVSAEHETVGGPIDVAFVSRYDGFAWVRRKGSAPETRG